MKLRLNVAAIPCVDVGMDSGELGRAAADISEATLRLRIAEPDNPTRGLVVPTIELSPMILQRYSKDANDADALDLSRWGWRPFSGATNDRRSPDARIHAVKALERIMDQAQSYMIPQNEDLKEDTWTSVMSFETSTLSTQK